MILDTRDRGDGGATELDVSMAEHSGSTATAESPEARLQGSVGAPGSPTHQSWPKREGET
jgi:hypothetical protein